jgi:hypothetical protein
MKKLEKGFTQRQLRVGEMIKQALSLIFIRDEAKIPNIDTKEIYRNRKFEMSQDSKNC